MRTLRCGLVILSMLGCLGAAVAAPRGNAALGIAEFAIEETPTRTSVVGLDATGAVVGRLKLVHGRFALTGIFRDDYDIAEVVGRQLSVAIAGQELSWETAGFEPTLHMPAHPPGHETLAAFLEDRRVREVLDRWGIGFERASVSGETAALLGADEGAVVVSALHAGPHYVAGTEPGTLVQHCSAMTACGSVRGFPVNTCGAGAAADLAIRITRAEPNSSEDLVTQCCPAGSGGQTVAWFAIKVCPTSGTTSTCGTTTAACKACPGYPAAASQLCHMHYQDGATDYCYSNDGAAPHTLIAQPNPPQLWPPNHARVTIDLASCLEEIVDPCNPELTAEEIVNDPSFTLDYIGSDEPSSKGGAPNISDDISRVGPHTVSVKRESNGGVEFDGRVYHAGISYINGFGLSTSLDCRFGVPQDRGAHAVAQDSWIDQAGSPLNPGFVIFDPEVSP